VLVRRLQALEGLAAVDTFVFDKTGTLTRDAMKVRAVQVRSGAQPDQVLALAGALARQSLHPVSRALALAAQDLPQAQDWQAREVVETTGQGLQGRVSGAAGELAGRSLRLGSAAFCGLPDAAPTGQHQTHLSDGAGWLGTFELTQDIRPDARTTVDGLRAAGLAVHMLSGDDAGAAKAVAAEVGIGQVLPNCTPDAKLDHVRALQAGGSRVAMVGDGLNDAPVLAAADVSFAFGQAVPLAQSQADFVVLGEGLADVGRTVLVARRTMRIVRQNLWWALGYNIACVPLAVAGYLPAWLAGLGMAASSLLVVLNALRLSAGARQAVAA
jgi:Cu2+-exporting ATPase